MFFFLLVLFEKEIKYNTCNVIELYVCVPLRYLILMPDIQEAKRFEFTV